MGEDVGRRPLQEQVDALRGRVTFAIDLEKKLLARLDMLGPGTAAMVCEELRQSLSRKPEDEHAARGYRSELERLEVAIQRHSRPPANRS